jgi:hypothetical protein
VNARLLAAAAVLSIVTGCSVAYCQHQDGPTDTAPCAGVAWAAPAATKVTPRKTGPALRREVVKEPHGYRSTPRVRKAPPRPSASPSHRHGNHIDLDLDMDGC